MLVSSYAQVKQCGICTVDVLLESVICIGFYEGVRPVKQDASDEHHDSVDDADIVEAKSEDIK